MNLSKHCIPVTLLALAAGASVFGQSPLQGTPVYQPQGVIQTTPVQGSSTTRPGTVIQGSTIQGSAVQGSSTTQGSTVQGSVMQGMPVVETFETKFWNYLQRSHYKNWAPVPGRSGAVYAGQSPHGANLKMYLNRTAAGTIASPDYGSIIVKENYGPDAKTLMAITVMYKTRRDYDAQNGDWYYVKYNPNGTVATTPPDKGSMLIKGKFASCIECHSGANGEDFVFANDE